MKKQISIIFMLLPILCFAQGQGIKFEQAANWEAVKAKAKSENKYIFVDCYTTWCGPCKQMDSEVFSQEKVGSVMNSNFVNLKLQMDTAKADSEAVQAWYGEARRFENDYEVYSYPTFLIFNPAGEMVHRITGGSDADEFIARTKVALDPEKQDVTLLKKFAEQPNDPVVLREMIDYTIRNNEVEMKEELAERYLSIVDGKSLLNAQDVDFLARLITSPESKAFQIVKDNMPLVDELLAGRWSANNMLASTLFTSILYPEMLKGNTMDLDLWQEKLAKEYPYVDMEFLFAQLRVQYAKPPEE